MAARNTCSSGALFILHEVTLPLLRPYRRRRLAKRYPGIFYSGLSLKRQACTVTLMSNTTTTSTPSNLEDFDVMGTFNTEVIQNDLFSQVTNLTIRDTHVSSVSWAPTSDDFGTDLEVPVASWAITVRLWSDQEFTFTNHGNMWTRVNV